MDQTAFRTSLATDRFDEAVEVHRPANEGLGIHTHEFEAKALIIQGELDIGIKDGNNDAIKTYKVGDIFHLAANTPHTEKYGPVGVTYLVGRKHIS
jgi:quercetin dioxygenase-like cupin family protein